MNDITQFLTGFGGLGIFAIVLADQAGLPIPAPPFLLAAGALVAGGKLNPWLAAAMTVLAALLADALWFFLGRKSNQRMLHLLSRWSLSRNASVEHAKSVVASHGLFLLVVGKFLPGAVATLLAGALGMSTRRFMLFDGVAALFYAGCYLSAGFLFHDQVKQIIVWSDGVGHGVIGLGLVVLVGYAAYKYVLRRRTMAGKGEPTNRPGRKTGFVDAVKSVAHLDPTNLVMDKAQTMGSDTLGKKVVMDNFRTSLKPHAVTVSEARPARRNEGDPN